MLLNCVTHYSLQKSITRIWQLCRYAAINKVSAIGIADAGNITGSIELIESCESTCQCGYAKKLHKDGKGKCFANNNCEAYVNFPIKPVIGCRFPQFSAYALNEAGYKSLSRMVSIANNPRAWTGAPSIALEEAAAFGGCIFTFGEQLDTILFSDNIGKAKLSEYEECRKLVVPDWKEKISGEVNRLHSLLGAENVFFELDDNDLPFISIRNKILRFLHASGVLKAVPAKLSFYPESIDSADHLVLLAVANKTTLEKLPTVIPESPHLRSKQFHLPDPSFLNDQTLAALADRFVSYKVSSPPILRKFDCPNGQTSKEYLRSLCIQGWNALKTKLPKEVWQRYGNQVKEELKTFEEAGLEDYFLIVQDYCTYAKSKGWLMSPGRGSVGGSLVAMLIGINSPWLDPIKYELYFSRFFNSARKGSMPDIDCDFPGFARDSLINDYLKNKYGPGCVTHMLTLGEMKGKGALKDVLRVHAACGFDEMNKITDKIASEDKISDDLQEMIEEEGEASIIMWSLKNNSKELKDYCYIDENGKLAGPYSKFFEQAIRLEGVKKSQGKHASGIIISPEDIDKMIACVYDPTSGEYVLGYEMGVVEKLGFIKFDILSLDTLDRLMTMQKLLAGEDDD